MIGFIAVGVVVILVLIIAMTLGFWQTILLVIFAILLIVAFIFLINTLFRRNENNG